MAHIQRWQQGPQTRTEQNLRAFRATPHLTTGSAPGAQLYGANFFNKMANLRSNKVYNKKDTKDARKRDAEQKDIIKK